MHPVIRELAQAIDRGWRAQGSREEAFPEVAAKALQDVAPHARLDLDALLESLALDSNEDSGLDHTGDHVSSSVVPLYAGPRFGICAHLWVDTGPPPHCHAWSGAYQNIGGSSIHALYDFTETNCVDPKFGIGDLTLARLENHHPGKTVPVWRGTRMLHAITHVERPTVNLSVRSIENYGGMTMDFWRPGIRIESGLRDIPTASRAKCLRFLAETRPDRYASSLRRVCERADMRTCFLLLEPAYKRHRDLVDPASIAEIVRSRWGADGDRMLAAMDEITRHDMFLDRRQEIRDLELRWFLGALYLSSDRHCLLQLLSDRFPGEAAPKLEKWIEMLTENDPSSGSTPSGLPKDAVLTEILKVVVRKPRLDDVIAHFRAEYRGVDASLDVLSRAYHALASRSIFAVLFQA